MQNRSRVELLQAEVDDDDQSFFSLLVDGQAIKYITIEPGTYSADDMCFGPSLISILPNLPPGDWNDGLNKNGNDGQPQFAHARRTIFPGVKNTWHGTYVDYVDIVVGKKLPMGIYEIAKFARFDWEIRYIENETVAYQWIDGHGIGPKFLGHLTEDGRVIGFLLERITNARHACPQDLESCQQVLSRLHDLGVLHGDTNRFNFLIHNSKFTLMDFDSAQKCNNQDMLLKEFNLLPGHLQNPSNRGGGGLL
ncbi:hypothetical protein MW887_009931 [Aspergillus wentii]|nr:hypothetical protein MW887_009931 [Aspergillus wentii]